MNDITSNSKEKTPSKSLRQAARVTGTLWVVLGLLLIVVGYLEGLQSSSDAASKPPPDILLIASVICLVIAFGGLIIAWWREGIGGFISLFGFILAGILFKIDPKLIFSLPVFLILLVPSILYLAYWWNAKKLSAENSNQ